MLTQGIVQNPASRIPDGLGPPATILGVHGETLVSELHGKYFSQMVRGNVYHAATALAGVTLMTSGGVAPTFGLWNPAGSGKILVPTTARFGWNGTTGTVASIGWVYLNGLNANVAGTSKISAATFLTPVNGNLALSGSQSVGLVIATATISAAGTVFRWVGAGQGAPIATTAAVYPMQIDVFDGEVGLAPGSAMFAVVSTAVGNTHDISMAWEEVPFS